MILDEELIQIKKEVRAWQYLTRRQKDELLDKLIAGKIPVGYIEP